MSEHNVKKGFNNILFRVHLIHRIVFGLIFSALIFLLIFHSSLDRLVIATITWNAFAFAFILISWFVFFSRTREQMRLRAKEEDGSRVFVFFMILLSCFASMFAVLLLVLSQHSNSTPRIIYVPLAICTMLFSWIMVHTTFCFHYAHLYYGDMKGDSATHAGGLEFPGKGLPEYMDFVYFSFVIGMTFQVSDVSISSRVIRRLALFHGLLAFGLNTFVVALTINLIAGLKS